MRQEMFRCYIAASKLISEYFSCRLSIMGIQPPQKSSPKNRWLIGGHPTCSSYSPISHIYIYTPYLLHTSLKVLRPYFLSPCRKWHKKGSSPRNHSNAEVLRPRVYSNVVGFHGRGFIAMSWVLRPRVFSNIHSQFTHDSLTISHDFRAAICTF